MKKGANNLPVGSSMRREIKKGNSTQKGKSKRSTPRFYEVKIRITAEDYARGLPFFGEQKYLSRYVLDGFKERLNRAEANSKSARLRILAGNVELLEPIMKEMYKLGKLDFLKESVKENGDG